MEEAEKQVQDDLDEDRCTTAWKDAIAKIVNLLKKKAKELTAKTDKEYKKELTTIDAVQALSDAGARAALSALGVIGRGDTKLRIKDRHALLIEHLGLTE